jgi:hypothetical protein
LCAKILPACAAERAFATGPTHPGDADARAGGKPFRVLTALDDFTDNFMSRHERTFRMSQFVRPGLPELRRADSPIAFLRVARRHKRRFDRTQFKKNFGATQYENVQMDADFPRHRRFGQGH